MNISMHDDTGYCVPTCVPLGKAAHFRGEVLFFKVNPSIRVGKLLQPFSTEPTMKTMQKTKKLNLMFWAFLLFEDGENGAHWKSDYLPENQRDCVKRLPGRIVDVLYEPERRNKHQNGWHQQRATVFISTVFLFTCEWLVWCWKIFIGISASWYLTHGGTIKI